MYYRQTVKVGDWDLVKGLNWSPLWSDEEEEDGETVQWEKISRSRRRPLIANRAFFWLKALLHYENMLNGHLNTVSRCEIGIRGKDKRL